MNYEQAPMASQEKKVEEHFTQGFEAEWLQNSELLEKAKKFAEFYRKQIDAIDFEITKDEEILIHFTTDGGFKNITNSEQTDLENNSNFYDGGREKLEKLDVNLAEMDEKFGNSNCVVAIPIREFDKWTQSLSWLKLTNAGVLKNAFIFKMSKKDILLRDGRMADEMFKIDISKEDKGEKEMLRKQYFTSTSHYNENLFSDDSMLEAWIPHKIFLENSISVNYQE